MRSLPELTLAKVEEYWARELGCTREELRPLAPRVQVHRGGISGFPGVFILAAGAAPVISAPSDIASVLRPSASRFTSDTTANVVILGELLLRAAAGRIVGPSQLSYVDAASFRRVKAPPSSDTRELNETDLPHLWALKAHCPPAEWEPKNFNLEAKRSFGAFGDNGELLAVADFAIWDEQIAHIGVITRPAVRGQGYGTLAVAAAVSCALDAGLVPQYWALRENQSSLAIRAKLGFRDFAWTMAVRFAA